MKVSFQQELQQDITRRFGILTIIVSGMLLILFFSLFFAVQYYQLRDETRAIAHSYQTIEQENFHVLNNMNADLIPGFLRGKRTEREVYSEFYSQIAQHQQRGELLIIDSNNDIQFTTNDNWSTSLIAQNYLNTVISTSHSTQMTRITTDNNKNHYLILFKEILSGQEHLGYSILFLNGNDFMQHTISNGTQYLIADQYDNVFSRSSNQFIRTPLEKVDSTALASPLFFLDRKLFLNRSTVLNDTMTLHTYIPLIPIQLLLMLTFFSTFILAAVLFSQSFRLAKKIAERNSTAIQQLVTETSLITHGYKTQLSITSEDEFGFLAKKINLMLNEMNQLYAKMLELEKQSIQYERKMLEAQFNPHFLYNTLETIRVTISTMPDIALQLIQSLNRVLRYSLSDMKQETTLHEDLAILQDFLEVNNIRFEKLTYNISCDPSLDLLAVPRLCLLPLVENSLKYGMRERNDLAINVLCYQKNKQYVFEVWDNGSGLTEKQQAKIQKQIKIKQTHHGLVNSFRRLEMFFKTVDLDILRQNQQTIIRFTIEGGHDDV